MGKAPAGLVDAGASSLATFVAGVAATRVLDAAELGVYAVFFSASLLASQLPTQLVLVPAEAKMAHLQPAHRTNYLLRSLKLALPASAVAAAGVLATQFFLTGSVDSTTATQLAITASAVAGIFPLQDHARRVLHLAGAHWLASWASVIRLFVVSAAIVLIWRSRFDPALLPFGSLVIGDLCALLYCVLVARPQWHPGRVLSLMGLVRTGKWILLGASMGPGAGFIVNLLVTTLAGSASLGLAEAARVASQPVFVLAIGLSTVVRPASMEAAIRGDEKEARRLSRRLTSGLTVASVLYLLILLLPASINPIERLVPKAFTLPGLVELSLVAGFFNGIVLLQRAELIAIDRTRSLSAAEALSSFSRVVLALFAGILRAWAVPLGLVVGGLIRQVSFSRILAKVYDSRGPCLDNDHPGADQAGGSKG